MRRHFESILNIGMWATGDEEVEQYVQLFKRRSEEFQAVVLRSVFTG
jgi:hypothetical protein